MYIVTHGKHIEIFHLSLPLMSQIHMILQVMMIYLISLIERSGISPSSGEADDFLFPDLSETEIDTEISTEVDEELFHDALSPISSGELEYSPSYSEASSNDDHPPGALEPEIEIQVEDIEIDFEAITDFRFEVKK